MYHGSLGLERAALLKLHPSQSWEHLLLEDEAGVLRRMLGNSHRRNFWKNPHSPLVLIPHKVMVAIPVTHRKSF